MTGVPLLLAAVLAIGLVTSSTQVSESLMGVDSELIADDRLGIYSGNSTTMNTHRYLVGILKNGSFLCAGIIVSSRWVLTLGDCTKSQNASLLTVVASSSDGVTGGQHYGVEQVVPHPDYGTATLDYDFACVQINATFYYGKRRAHKLPIAEPKNYTTMMVAGYGCTTSSCTTRELRKTSMQWLPKDNCSTTFAKYNLKWERVGCAYNPNGGTLCKGDFGSAFVRGQVFYGLFASASSSGFCTSSALPVILADVYPVADWVRNVTSDT